MFTFPVVYCILNTSLLEKDSSTLALRSTAFKQFKR